MATGMTERPLTKVLIANRGEIAVRIARTCHAMGIGVVAIYSSADAHALHVQMADEAYLVGPPPALESYLDQEAILDIALKSGADAVHPGYGFLAENPEFAAAVQRAGLIWIGPSPEVIALLGDKVAAKELARAAGVPVVPGYAGDEQSAERMQKEAAAIGYPVMLKAAAGGGGKGMRAVWTPNDLVPALEGAARESQAAFGDDRIFLEKLIEQPRHVEIQVLLDEHGQGVYLGERDCSIQRRHQKVVEEAPSPVVSEELRSRMGEDALRLVRAGSYTNAGTVEFLVQGKSYYFLEVNTRIQVEHPVTEMVTGLDLIRRQLEIAAGGNLGLSQADVHLRGHAIEARIYAEDPATGFLPSTGVLRAFRPPEGAGIRNDVGVYPGAEVTPYYDPMLAKLIVHAPSREEAVLRLGEALSGYDVDGPTTNLDFLRWLSGQAAFRNGEADIDFIAQSWHPGEETPPPFEVLAAAAAALVSGLQPSTVDYPQDPWRLTSGWRLSGMPRLLTLCFQGTENRLALSPVGDGSWRIRQGDREVVYDIHRGLPGILILRDGSRVHRFDISLRGSEILVVYQGEHFAIQLGGSAAVQSAAAAVAGGGDATAPMPGTVVKVMVREGQQVMAREPLVILEAMKMEHVVEAPHDGVISAVLVAVGELVAAGSPVVTLESA